MSRLDTHVAAVRRKLTLAKFVPWLARCLFVVACAAIVAIVLMRLTRIAVPLYLLWAGMGAAVVAALLIAVIGRPSRQAAAVAIDERLALKEKFSTALSIRHVKDPMAQAAVRDAESTADKVHLAGQFTIEFPRAGYWSIGAMVVALMTFFMMPNFDLLHREEKAAAEKREQMQIAESKQIVKEAIAKIESMPKAVKDSESLRIVQRQLEEMLNEKAPDPGRVARKTVEALSKADEALKQQAQANQQYAQAQKNQTMFKSMNPPVDAKGPVAEAQRKIVQGDYAGAAEELKQLADKLKDMDDQQKKEAAAQMQQMANALSQIAQDPRAMERLADQMKQMNVNPQQIQQAKDLLQRAAQGDPQAQQQIQQMQQQIVQQMNNGQGANAQQMQQLQQMMQAAQQAAAGQSRAQQMAQGMQQMAQGMQQMGQGGQQGQGQMAQGQQAMEDALAQLDMMQQDLQQMQAAQQGLQDALAQACGQCAGNEPGNGNPPGQAGQGDWKEGDINNQGNGMGGPGIGNGGRGQKSASPFSSKTEFSPSPYDEKGKHLASMYVKNGSIKGESRLELEQVIESAAADEGDDIDDTRADARSQEVQKRYFSVIRDDIE